MIQHHPRVAIVILNWNGWRDTLPCLESLTALTYPNTNVIVVDNGSTDESVDVIARAHPEVELIATGENLGFADGNNVGIRRALEGGADHVLLLNNDTTVAPDSLGLLVEAVEADPTVGVTGPTIYYYDEPARVWSAGGTIDWRRGDTFMIGLNAVDEGQFGHAPRPVDFVTGCAMLVDRATWERAGLLDGRFFMYYEETEWCARATAKGVGIVHVPDAKIWHKISPVQQAATPRIHYLMTRNRLLFLRCSGAPVSTWARVTFAYARTLASWSLRSKWRDKRDVRDVMVRAITDFARGQFGPFEPTG